MITQLELLTLSNNVVILNVMETFHLSTVKLRLQKCCLISFVCFVGEWRLEIMKY